MVAQLRNKEGMAMDWGKVCIPELVISQYPYGPMATSITIKKIDYVVPQITQNLLDLYENILSLASLAQ